MSQLKVFSFGGGQNSMAALVLAAQGDLDYRTFLFANVGDDSEQEETIAYTRDIAIPYARANDLELHEVQRQWKDGREFESIYTKMMNCPEGKLREPIPIRGQNGMPLSRSCTVDWKVMVTGAWCRQHGATPENPVIKGIGYTSNELSRINPSRALPFETLVYPLVSAPAEYPTGLHMNRDDCVRVIAAAGLPVPPPSHCWFCPLHSIEQWHAERRTHPERFGKSVALERTLNERRDGLGKPHVYLTRFGRPLDEVVRDGVDLLPMADDEAFCDAGGGCFT